VGESDLDQVICLALNTGVTYTRTKPTKHFRVVASGYHARKVFVWEDPCGRLPFIFTHLRRP